MSESAPVTSSDESPNLGAERYAAYVETPAGRLRCDVAFANLEEFLPRTATGRLRALDLGGTGEMAIRLARRAGVSCHVVLAQGDVAASPSFFPEGSFDVIVCRHVLEYTQDPVLVLRGAARVMRCDPTAVLSVVARKRAGTVLNAAIQSGDLSAAELRTMLTEASLEPVAERGVRVVFDYLRPSALSGAGASRVVALERAPSFQRSPRYTQMLARPRMSTHARVGGGT